MSIDKLLLFIKETDFNKGYSWKNHGISSERVANKNLPPNSDELPQLWEVAKNMIEMATANGHLQKT